MPDVMVYYTWSQGFRPGGFDENGGTGHIYGTDGQLQYLLPRSWDSDKLTNNEIGWKTEFFDHRFQWNGAVYRENWDNVQISFFDPGLLGNLFFNTNGQNFLVKGLETSMVARVVSGLTVQGAASWNQTRQTNSPALIDNNPLSANFGHPITQQCDSTGANCAAIVNPFGPVGSPTANAPPLQFSLRARYEWSFGDYNSFAQFGASHQGHSFTQAGSNPTFAARIDRHRHFAAAIRKSRVFELFRVGRNRQGCLERDAVRRESGQFACVHLHQYRQFHRGTDAAAAARARSSFGYKIR